MLLVLIGHCSYYTIHSDYGGIDHAVDPQLYSMVSVNVNRLIAFIYSFHMPFFMMISGCTYAISVHKKTAFGVFLHGKFVRLIIPFMLVTAFLSVPLKYLSGYWDASADVATDILLGQFLLMGNSHLWFVVSLFWIFLIAYPLTKRSGAAYNRLVLLLAVLLNLLSLAVPNNLLGIHNAMAYFLYFYVGYLLYPFINRMKTIPSLHLGVLFVLLYLFQSLYRHLVTAYDYWEYVQLMHSILYMFGALLTSFTCFCLCKKVASTLFDRTIKRFFGDTYEIYLYSDPFNYVIIFCGWTLWGERVLTFNGVSLAMFMIRLIGTFIFAYLVVGLVRLLRVKELRRFC